MVERVPENSGTRPEPNFSRSGMYPTLPESNLMKQNIKFGVKSAQYPTKYPTFWVPESDFLKSPPYPTWPESDFLLSDLFDTWLFAIHSTTNSDIVFFRKLNSMMDGLNKKEKNILSNMMFCYVT